MKKKIAVLIATWFYAGLIPPVIFRGMAGTYGSFFSIPFVWAVLYLSPWLYFVVLCLIYNVGIWSVPITEHILGPRTDWKGKTKTRDQNQIVIDETFGMLVTCAFLSPTHPSICLLLLVGFGFFRLFDIIKPWPTKYFDRMETEDGVMLDDLVAGVYALICLQFIIWFFNL